MSLNEEYEFKCGRQNPEVRIQNTKEKAAVLLASDSWLLTSIFVS
jgi:hypothetical protein